MKEKFKKLFKIAFIAIIVFAVVVTIQQRFEPKDPFIPDPPTRAEMLREVNEERARAGVPPLMESPELDQSAQAKVDDMVTNGYYDHVDSHGKHGYEYIDSKLCNYVAENLDLIPRWEDNYASEHVASWYLSTPHRKVMLSTKYTLTGFGINGNEVVEHFCQTR